MIHFLFEVCESSSVLSIIYLFKIILSLVVSIVVPIGLIIMLIITFAKAMMGSDASSMDKIAKTAVKRVIFACCIYFVPTLVNVVINVADIESDYAICYEHANKTYIAAKALEESIQEEIERKELEEKNKRQQEEMEREKEQEKIDNSDADEGVVGDGDNSNKSGPVKSNNITYINVSDLAVPLYPTGYQNPFPKLPVNSEIADEMHNILYNISVYVKNNPQLIKRFETAGAYVEKEGYHGRGLAIDLFNQWTFTKNGKTYRPYGQYKYPAWESYNTFICEVCNGKENCEYNINYIIYKKFFEGNGWCWGGNWSAEYYDPMHYELSDNGCYIANKNFSC